MALSQEEQRLLDQMEAALAAEDPRLANTLRGTNHRRIHRRQAAIAGVGFLVGIGALVFGMQTHPAISIVGFVIMLVSTIVAVRSWRHAADAGEPAQQSKPSSPKQPNKQFMDRLEDRWRRRMGGDADQ
jgi:hypothetical protein